MKSHKYFSIAAIGDSLTNEQPVNWLSLLGQMHPGLTTVCNAHPGWTTKSYFKEHLRARAFDRLVPGEADLYIILLGSNDLFEAEGGSDLAVQTATEGVRRIARYAIDYSVKAQVVVAAPPRIVLEKASPDEASKARRVAPHTMEYLSRLGDSYRALAVSEGWNFVDLFPLLAPEDFGDAAHPNDSGNRKLADEIWRFVRPIVQRHFAGASKQQALSI